MGYDDKDDESTIELLAAHLGGVLDTRRKSRREKRNKKSEGRQRKNPHGVMRSRTSEPTLFYIRNGFILRTRRRNWGAHLRDSVPIENTEAHISTRATRIRDTPNETHHLKAESSTRRGRCPPEYLSIVQPYGR